MVRILDIFFNTPDGQTSMVMEYENGGSLSNILESVGTLTEPLIQGIANTLLETICECHKANYFLNNISPSKIMFNKEG